jgi:hypothetical protein
MKIIKQVDTSAWRYSVTCKTCDSELEADANDIRHEHFVGDMREPSYDSYYMTCPVCFSRIDVDKVKLPKALQVKVKSNASSSGGPFDR